MAREETLTFNASNVQISRSWSGQKVDVTVDVEIRSYLEPLTEKQIVANVDEDELLAAIGLEKVKRYFGLIEADA